MFFSLVQKRQLQEFYLRNFNKMVENEDFCNSDKQWLQLRLLLIAENKKNSEHANFALLPPHKKKIGDIWALNFTSSVWIFFTEH
jgi:hypothetical protein